MTARLRRIEAGTGAPACPTCGTKWKHTARFKRRQFGALLGTTAVVSMTVGAIVTVVSTAARRKAR